MPPGKWYVELGNDLWRLTAPVWMPVSAGAQLVLDAPARLHRAPLSAQTGRDHVLPSSRLTNEERFTEDAALHRSTSKQSSQLGTLDWPTSDALAKGPGGGSLASPSSAAGAAALRQLRSVDAVNPDALGRNSESVAVSHRRDA